MITSTIKRILRANALYLGIASIAGVILAAGSPRARAAV
jgi:hypothetical protein